MPLLSPEQVQEIRQIIEDHHDAFVVNTIGPEAVTAEVLERLQEMGLVDIKVESIKDAYIYGQLMAMMQSPQVANMSFKEFKNYLKRNPVPLSAAEQHAVQMAQLNAGQYCKGLGNRGSIAAGDLVIEADAALRARTEGIIRDATALNIARRETVQKLRSDLGWATKQWSRDWTRIAVTEKQNAMQRGVADAYRKEYGPNALVAKRPMPDACRHCKRAYLGNDGQPIIFKLSELEANGTNVGRKAADWLPVVGTVHPHCHPAGSLVTTHQGEIPIEEVRPGDLVPTHTGKWQRVTHVWESGHDGPLVVIHLSDGREVRATLNHPLLTQRGWVAAENVQERDQFFSASASELAFPADKLDAEKQPTMLKKDRLFATVLNGFSRRCVPVTAVYFNGELYIREGQIDIEYTQSVVGDSNVANTSQPEVDLSFVGRGEFTDAGLSLGEKFFERCLGSPSGLIRFIGDPPLLPLGEFGHAKAIGLSTAAGRFSGGFDTGHNGGSGHLQTDGYFFYRQHLVEVHIEDGGGIEFNPPITVPSVSGHSVSPVPIVNVSMTWHRANVYNLTVASDHSYFVNGIVSHNCQCQMIRIPEGFGFDEEGRLVPGGELGERYGEEKKKSLASARDQTADLQKAIRLRGQVNYRGIPIAIENPAGSIRTWDDGQGGTGETEMLVGYGYIKRTNGTDEDEIDAFVGPDPKADMVYVVEQQLPKEGRYDEQKCLIGFSNQEMAEQVYQAHFDRPDFQLYTTAMTLDQFKRWIQETAPSKGEMMKASESKYRLVIPLRKARVTAVVGAAESPAGNRSPSQYGTSQNYVIRDTPDRPLAPSLKDVGYRPDSRELAEHFYQDFEAQNPLKRDREVYEFPESERIVRPVEVPEEMDEAQEEAREGHEDRMRYLLFEKIRNAPRPKNTPEIQEGTPQPLQKGGKDRAPTLNKQGKFNVIEIGPRGGKIIGYKGGKAIYLHKLSPRQKAKLADQAEKKPKREPVPKKPKKEYKEGPVVSGAPSAPYRPDPAPKPGQVADSARLGVPARAIPPPPKIPRLPNLTKDERRIESKFADAFEEDPDGMADAYYDIAADDNFVFETDAAKALMPEWSRPDLPEDTSQPIHPERAEARARYNTALHQTANAIVKRAFLKRLNEIAEMPEEQRQILVTSGGVASGKGSALKAKPELAQSAAATWDAAGEQNATENPWILEECEKRGIKPVFLFVAADPAKTWKGAIARARNIGRTVDARAFSDSYAYGGRNFNAFYRKNKDKATFVFAKVEWPNPAEFVDDIPEEAVNLDPEKVYQTALDFLQTQEDLPQYIRDGATAGRRIWGEGVAA